MSTPSEEDSLAQLLAAYVDGSQCISALVAGIDAGAPDLGIERSTWERGMTELEWFVTQLLTNEHVQCGPPLTEGGRPARQLTKGGRLITEEHVALVRRLKEQAREVMESGAGASELRPLAVECLETLWGPSWQKELAPRDHGLPPT